jgi:thioredoxin-dependent peroxiredoxin
MTVRVNDRLPDFTAESTGGAFSLAGHRGKAVVLYFYPKDSTPGCTTEGADFAKNHQEFLQANAVVVGASRDSLKSHANFKEKMSFPFELISDPAEALCEMFGVMKLKNMYGKQVRGIERSTFVIDRAGRLSREWRGVKVAGHVEQVLAHVQSLD